MTQVRVFPDEDSPGVSLAGQIVESIDAARATGRHHVLGYPGGRSVRSTCQALSQRVGGADLGHVIVAMTDDCVASAVDGVHPGPPHSSTAAAVLRSGSMKPLIRVAHRRPPGRSRTEWRRRSR